MNVSPLSPQTQNSQVMFGAKRPGKAALTLTGLLAAGALAAGCSDGGANAARNAIADEFQKCESDNVSVEQHKSTTSDGTSGTTIKACGDQTLLNFTNRGEYTVADTPELTNVEVRHDSLSADYRDSRIEIQAGRPNSYQITNLETGEVISSNASGTRAGQ